MKRCFALILLVPMAITARATIAAGPEHQAAVKAAAWIGSAGVRMPIGVAWPAVPPERESIQTNLYSGVAGTVLFFLEMNAATGEKSYLDQAVSGADFILASLPSEKSMGLYDGLAGLSVMLEETFKASGEKRFRDGFQLGLETLKARALRTGSGVEWDSVTDIISGSAGIGLVLLYASRELGDPSFVDLAARAGHHLIELGKPEAGGLKWAMSPDFPRLMPNFSHGTAGVAYFLAELYGRTMNKSFLNAALSGGKYLTSIADRTGDGCLIFHDEPDGRSLYYLGWCHGPAGTARLFDLLFEETRDKNWKEWMIRAARSVIHSGIPEKQTPGFWNNAGLCCGTASVGDFFLDLYRATKDPAYLDFAKRLASSLLAKAVPEGNGLKWIQAEHRVRPELLEAQTGLMQGAAGIGLFLIRLDEFEQGKKRRIVLPDDPFETSESETPRH